MTSIVETTTGTAASRSAPADAAGSRSADSLDLLSRVSKGQVRDAPYPHLIARDLLDADLVARLIAELPELGTITGGKPYGNNQRHSYPAHRLLADPAVGDAWKALVSAQLTQGFLDRFLELFRPRIDALYPQLAGSRLRAGIRRLLARDDGSDDGTPNLLRRLARHDRRIRPVQDDLGNLGPTGGFARLMALALSE